MDQGTDPNTAPGFRPKGGQELSPRLSTTDEFQDYLKAEYDHIAEAHFRTIEAISSFFRYYLLIMSVPLTVLGLFVGLSDNVQEVVEVVKSLQTLLGVTFFVIAFVGFLVMLYIINLRMDVILYARTVNAIRKHFYDQAVTDINAKLRTRVLPQTPMQPGYEERGYFLPVVMSFAFLNSFYLWMALNLFEGPFEQTFQGTWAYRLAWWPWLVAFFFVVFHGLCYRWYAQHRERAYLRSFALGVDIDGVLNKHREHFCRLLRDKLSKSLDPDSITTIPLHDCPVLGVSREDERKVFNDPSYWMKMPVVEGAAENMRRLRNALRLRIHIFSHRPWPSVGQADGSEHKAIDSQWKAEASKLIQVAYHDSPVQRAFNHVQLWLGISEQETARVGWYRVDRRLYFLVRWLRSTLGASPIEIATKCWLRLSKIEYNSLTLERGNEDVSDPQGHFRNRFYVAQQKKLRFFVEDDLEKATKLAYICDVVFLLEQPYNRNTREPCLQCEKDCKKVEMEVPNNVIPVKSWDDIYRHIRRLS